MAQFGIHEYALSCDLTNVAEFWSFLGVDDNFLKKLLISLDGFAFGFIDCLLPSIAHSLGTRGGFHDLCVPLRWQEQNLGIGWIPLFFLTQTYFV